MNTGKLWKTAVLLAVLVVVPVVCGMTLNPIRFTAEATEVCTGSIVLGIAGTLLAILAAAIFGTKELPSAFKGGILVLVAVAVIGLVFVAAMFRTGYKEFTEFLTPTPQPPVDLSQRASSRGAADLMMNIVYGRDHRWRTALKVQSPQLSITAKPVDGQAESIAATVVLTPTSLRLSPESPDELIQTLFARTSSRVYMPTLVVDSAVVVDHIIAAESYHVQVHGEYEEPFVYLGFVVGPAGETLGELYWLAPMSVENGEPLRIDHGRFVVVVVHGEIGPAEAGETGRVLWAVSELVIL